MKKRVLSRKRNVKKQDLSRRRRLLIIGLLSLVLLSGLGYAAYEGLSRMELFNLKKIEIAGNPQSISAEKIKELSGLILGTNLFKLDLNKTKDRVKRHEYFKAVYVSRQFPNSILIEVQEYQPAFILYTQNFYYVSEQGEIYRDITQTQDSRDYPVLTGINEDQLLKYPLKVKEIIQKAAKLKKAYLESSFAQQFGISEINFDKNIGFTLYPEKSKYSIRWGNKDFEKKASKLTKFWESLDDSSMNVSIIDLTYPKKVWVKL